ncbi:MAG: SIMPL domain-containing protein [Patescibacteria group bacterium]|jgi:uncharacterized protein YggE
MDQKIKVYFGIGGFALLAVVAFSVASYAHTYSRSIEPSAFRSFTVSGEGKMVTIPDVAKFSFTVLTQGGINLAELQKENTGKANDAIAFVKSKEVKEKDIATQSYNVTPRYQHFDCRPSPQGGSVSCPPPEIVGYEVSQTVNVKIRNFNVIGDLLTGVVENGANSVSQLSFTIDDPTSVENEARNQAIEKARAKAKSIAKAGDFRLGRLLAIQEDGGFPPYARVQSLSAKAFNEAALAPTIEPGSQDVRVAVTLTYEIR